MRLWGNTSTRFSEATVYLRCVPPPLAWEEAGSEIRLREYVILSSYYYSVIR